MKIAFAFILVLLGASLFLIGSTDYKLIDYSPEFKIQSGTKMVLLDSRIAYYEKKYSINPDEVMSIGYSKKQAETAAKNNIALLEKARAYAKTNCLLLKELSLNSDFPEEIILGITMAESKVNPLAVSPTAAVFEEQIKLYYFNDTSLDTVNAYGIENVPCFVFAKEKTAIGAIVQVNGTNINSTNTLYKGKCFGIPVSEWGKPEVRLGLLYSALKRNNETLEKTTKLYKKFNNCNPNDKLVLALAAWNSFNTGNTCTSIKKLNAEKTGEWTAQVLAFAKILKKEKIIEEDCSLIELAPAIEVKQINSIKNKPVFQISRLKEKVEGTGFEFKVNACAENDTVIFKDSLTGKEYAFEINPNKQCSLKLNKVISNYDISLVDEENNIINIKRTGERDIDFAEAISHEINQDTTIIRIEKQNPKDREAKLFIKDCKKGDLASIYAIENEKPKSIKEIKIKNENDCKISLENYAKGAYFITLKNSKNQLYSLASNSSYAGNYSYLIDTSDKTSNFNVFKGTNEMLDLMTIQPA